MNSVPTIAIQQCPANFPPHFRQLPHTKAPGPYPLTGDRKMMFYNNLPSTIFRQHSLPTSCRSLLRIGRNVASRATAGAQNLSSMYCASGGHSRQKQPGEDRTPLSAGIGSRHRMPWRFSPGRRRSTVTLSRTPYRSLFSTGWNGANPQVPGTAALSCT